MISVFHETRDMRNVTISMDDAMARWARIAAAEQDLSLSRFIATVLRREMERARDYDAAMEAYLSEPGYDIGDPAEGLPTRESLYDRPGIR